MNTQHMIQRFWLEIQLVDLQIPKWDQHHLHGKMLFIWLYGSSDCLMFLGRLLSCMIQIFSAEIPVFYLILSKLAELEGVVFSSQDVVGGFYWKVIK